MFKIYTTSNGDTPISIAKQQFGDPATSTEIIKLNNIFTGDSTPFPAGVKLKIPDIQPDTKSFDKTIEGENTIKNIQIEIGQKNFFPVNFNYFNHIAGARGASFELMNSDEQETVLSLFNYSEPVKIYVNNIKILTGYVLNVQPLNSINGRGLSVAVKSSIHTLLRSDIAPANIEKGIEWRGVGIRDIVNDIISQFSIEAIFSDRVLNEIDLPFDDGVSIEYGENIFDFIVRICRVRSMIVTDNENGDIVIDRAFIDIPVLTYDDTSDARGISNVIPIYNYEMLSGIYNIYSQYNGIAVLGTAKNDLIKLPIHKNINMPICSQGQSDELAEWLLCRDIGNAVKINMSIADFILPDSGNIIDVGKTVSLKDKLIGFDNEENLLIESMIFNFGDGAQGVSAVCVLPCAYTGIKPEFMPMV